MNEPYTWNAPDGSGSVRFSLKAYGIEIAVANGVDFEPYNAIKAISLIPEMSSDAACAVITFNRKEHGFFVRRLVWAERAGDDPSQAASYDRWIKALHQVLIDRGLASSITFRCGTRWNMLGWLFYAYPAIRVVALALIPIGVVGAVVTQSRAFAMMRIGGGIAMLLTPKIAKPNVPKNLQRIRQYSPEAIPEGCFASASPK